MLPRSEAPLRVAQEEGTIHSHIVGHSRAHRIRHEVRGAADTCLRNSARVLCEAFS